MRVLLLTDKLIFGGAEMYFCKLENRLQLPGTQFYFASSPGELTEKLYHKENYIQLQLGKHMYNLRKLADFIKQKPIHVLHANSLRMVIYAIMLKHMTGKVFKIIYTKHNITSMEVQSRSLFAWLINKYVSCVIAVSEYEKDKLTRCGVHREIIKVVYNGVDLEQFAFQPRKEKKKFRVGILARLSEEKNHSLFIKIANEMRKDDRFHFFLGGEGPEEQKLKKMIAQLGISESVKMLGKVKKPEQFIRDMDVLLLTSKREVFPMVILESMAVGTPVISIDRGGIKEAVIDKSSGYLIKDHTVEEYCEKIRYLASDTFSYETMAITARKRVMHHFSLDRMIVETLNEYKTPLEQSNQ